MAAVLKTINVDCGSGIWGIRVEVVVEIRESEEKPNIIKSITNAMTREVYSPDSPTYNWVKAEMKIANLKKANAQKDEAIKFELNEKDLMIEEVKRRATADETNKAIAANELMFDILSRTWLPSKVDPKPVYQNLTNEEVLALWGVRVNVRDIGHEKLSIAELPDSWSLVLRSILGVKPLDSLVRICIQDTKGQIRGYFDPTWFHFGLFLTPAVHIRQWSHEEGCDGVDVYLLGQKVWEEAYYHRDERAKQMLKNATTFADANYPLRHDPLAYW